MKPDYLTGNVLDVLKGLPDECIQTVVTSPPYYNLRDYGIPHVIWGGKPKCKHSWGEDIVKKQLGGTDKATTGNNKDDRIHFESKTNFCNKCNAWKGQLGLEPTPELYVEHLVMIFEEVKRVLRKDGTLWLNIGDSYASQPAGNKEPSGFSQTRPSRRKHGKGSETVDLPRMDSGLKQKDLVMIPAQVALALRSAGWYIRCDIIWNKPNPMPESVTDRPTKSHEYIFLLSKSKKYFYDNEAIKEPGQDWGERDRTNWKARRIPGQSPHMGCIDGDYSKIGRNKRSVWKIATRPYKEAHFAVFPPELPEICIKAGTAKNDIVLDIFAGSGTTLQVARSLGRRSIGIDINDNYGELAVKRAGLKKADLFSYGDD